MGSQFAEESKDGTMTKKQKRRENWAQVFDTIVQNMRMAKPQPTRKSEGAMQLRAAQAKAV